MLKSLATYILLGAFALPVCAHELWLERDGDGRVRVYLGEPDKGVIESGEIIAALAPTTQVFTTDPANTATLSVRDDHIQAQVDGNADIRAVNDQVWKPWENDQGELTAALMHARLGRTEVQARMDLELVPTSAGSDRFTLVFKGQPLPGKDVVLITPRNQAQPFKTDEQGLVELSLDAPGRYILAAGHETAANGQTVAGQAVDRLYHGTTTSFSVD